MCKFSFKVMILLKLSLVVFSYNKHDEKRNTNLNECVVNIDGTEININKLNNASGYELFLGNNTYILNICGPALKCQHHDASACIINEKKEIKVIGLLSKISLHQSKLKYKYDKKAETQIEFKCNRHLKSPDVEYISRSGTGRIRVHKFIFHTSLVCVKPPSTCQISDVEKNLKYDVTPLYNANRNWIVKNVSNEVTVYLNICGDLLFIPEAKNTECEYKGTQICAVDRFRKVTNLGVFPTEFTPNDSGLSISFTGGSLCNNVSSIITKLDLICSFSDSGPVLSFNSECEYNIAWRTPAACPYYISFNEDCILSNSMHGWQKEPLYFSRDKEQQLSRNLKMKYNICEALSQSCHGHMNVSFCLINNNKEIIFGNLNKTLISKDATVYINLIGEMCGNKNKRRTVNIQFRCDYTADKKEEISISKDLCSAKVTVFTVKVCRQPDKPDINCKISVNNSHYYDLTPLTSENHNYEVTDPNDPSQVYLLNVCLPVIFDTDSLCTPGAIVCLRNNTEPNKHKRFRSLGNYKESSGLQILSDKLVVQYEDGICPYSSSVNYKAVIEFKCSHQTQVSEIKLFNRTECEYNFIWKTKYACATAHIHHIRSVLKNTINKEYNDKKFNGLHENVTENHEEHITTETIQDTKEKEYMQHDAEVQSTVPPENINNITNVVPISMYVPVEVPSSSGIFINNCTLKDKFNNFNMYGLPKETHASSKSGKIYSVNICHQPERVMCATRKCLTTFQIAVHKQFVVVNFTDVQTKCNDRFYNSTIFFKCSATFQKPEVIQEQECSVQLEWKNEAACAFHKSDFKYLKAQSGSTTAQIIGITIASILIVVCISGLAGRYYFKRKQRINDSAIQLVRCEYSKMKDSTKIA